MQTDVLLVQINSQYIHSSLAPWYLTAALEQYGVARRAKVLELHINQPMERLLACIVTQKPTILGFCCYIWNIEIVEKLCGAIASILPETMLVLGGPEVSCRARDMLKKLASVRYVIEGAGEFAFAELCAGQSASQIAGLWYRENGKIKGNTTKPLPLPPPSPYTQEYFSSLNGRISYFEASRGCPFSCAFCLSGRADKVTFFPMEQTKSALLSLAQSGTRTIKFVDRTFNCNTERSCKIWKWLLDWHAQGLVEGVCFHFEIGADLLDEACLELLSRAPAGLFQLEAGLQSFQEKTLLACDRKTDMARLTSNLRRLIQRGNMHVHIDLIAGLPYENFSSFEQSFNQAFALRPHMLQLGFLKLIYGSKLRKQAKQYGYQWSPYPPYEVLSCNDLCFDELQRLKTAEGALDRYYNSGRFSRTLDCLLKNTQEPPFALFEALGNVMRANEKGNLAQNDLIELVMTRFIHTSWAPLLRDALVLDLLSTTANGVLPKCLQVDDARLAKFKRKCFDEFPEIKRQVVAILYAGGAYGVMVNHDVHDPVTGQGEVRLF